jgi:hypothetical protein
MRRVVGILLMLIAVLAATVGAGIAIVLGTDNRAETGPHRIATSSPVVVADPDVFGWAGPTVTMRIDVDKDQQVFIGAGNAVDIADYVGSSQRTEITGYEPPWSIETRDVVGEAPLPAAPGAVDWWTAQSAGTGAATISFKLPEQAFSLVVIAIGGGDLDGLRVTASYDIDGGFGIGLGLIGFAVGLGLFGWIAFQGRPLVREGELMEDDEFQRDITGRM